MKIKRNIILAILMVSFIFVGTINATIIDVDMTLTLNIFYNPQNRPDAKYTMWWGGGTGKNLLNEGINTIIQHNHLTLNSTSEGEFQNFIKWNEINFYLLVESGVGEGVLPNTPAVFFGGAEIETILSIHNEGRLSSLMISNFPSGSPMLIEPTFLFDLVDIYLGDFSTNFIKGFDIGQRFPIIVGECPKEFEWGVSLMTEIDAINSTALAPVPFPRLASVALAPAPLPGSILLLGTGIGFLAIYRQRKLLAKK
jgi:hypothetical protein